MSAEIEMTGKTVEEAVQAAVNKLGVKENDVEVEVLETPSKKLFGLFGTTPAKVRVKIKNPPAETQTEKVEEISKFEVETQTEVENQTEEIKTQPVEEKILEENEPAEEVQKNPVDVEKSVESAKKFLSEVFSIMKMEVEIEVKETDEDLEFVLDLSGKNLGVLIGKRGQTLDALQYILNLSVNRENNSERIHFILDVENYRKRRTETLQKLAKSVAERAFRMRQEVRLEPMNRHERRIIHTALQNNDRVETYSKGEEPYRYIIVSPKRRGRIK